MLLVRVLLSNIYIFIVQLKLEMLERDMIFGIMKRPLLLVTHWNLIQFLLASWATCTNPLIIALSILLLFFFAKVLFYIIIPHIPLHSSIHSINILTPITFSFLNTTFILLSFNHPIFLSN